MSISQRSPAGEEADHRHHELLRARRERPAYCRTAEERDELTSSHVTAQPRIASSPDFKVADCGWLCA
jgi:hypothetical protein